MEYTILGRTGFRVSVAGLGCGGHNLKDNVASLLKPPLAQVDLERLERIFGNVDSVSGN